MVREQTANTAEIPKESDSAMLDDKERPVAAVERALSILAVFRGGDAELSLAELSHRTGLYKSTVVRLAMTLEGFGYLERTAAGGYRLGPTPLELAARYRASLQPPDIIRPYMHELVARTGESVTYSVPRGELRVCVFRVDSPSRIRDQISIGDVFPLGRGASGKVLQAFDAQADDKESAAIRKRLICSSVDELTEGIAGIAAPIFDEAGGVLGALSISGPKWRFTAQAMRNATPLLRDAACAITFKLGGDTRPFRALPAAGAERA